MTHHWQAVPAPAKINRFLHVLGRRKDGYHDLQTGFQFVSFGDIVHLRVRDDGEVVRTAGLDHLHPDADLAVRAARLIKWRAASPLGVEIRVEKRIPEGGGFGGGSSDAAAVLVALNQLWNCDFSADHLMQIGLELGADVPVFVNGNAAFAEGVGEQLHAVEYPEQPVLLLFPKEIVSTAKIFADPALTRDSLPIKIRGSLDGVRNDCEKVVCAHYPKVAEALAWARQFGPAMMTGTGAGIFVPLPTQQAADSLLRKVPENLVAQISDTKNVSDLRLWSPE